MELLCSSGPSIDLSEPQLMGAECTISAPRVNFLRAAYIGPRGQTRLHPTGHQRISEQQLIRQDIELDCTVTYKVIVTWIVT